MPRAARGTTRVEYDTAEIARLGEDLYERDLRAEVEPGNLGEFLVLDILTGRYVIAKDDVTATLRLLDEVPEAVTYGVRIGKGAAYEVGSLSPTNPR